MSIVCTHTGDHIIYFAPSPSSCDHLLGFVDLFLCFYDSVWWVYYLEGSRSRRKVSIAITYI